MSGCCIAGCKKPSTLTVGDFLLCKKHHRGLADGFGVRKHQLAPLPNVFTPDPDRERYVYFVRSGPYIKIGQTRDLHARMSALRSGHNNAPADIPTPRQIELLVAFPSGNESYFLTRFRPLHVCGEWFRAEPELLDAIEGMRIREAATA